MGGDPGWSEESRALLTDWHNRMYAAQTGHYERADRFRMLHYVLGIPVVVLTTLAGTTLFASLGRKIGAVGVAVAATTMLGAVLASIQTFLRLGEASANHAHAADWYAAIRRDIEQLLAAPPHTPQLRDRALSKVRKEMNKCAQKSLELPQGKWIELAQRFNVREEFPSTRRHRTRWSHRAPAASDGVDAVSTVNAHATGPPP